MKGEKTPGGYTIVEVMIVLAISSLMFLIAATFINGKEEATSFPQGVNELASNIQNTIEQVNAGQYSDVGLSCQPGASSLVITFESGQETQGTQSNCIFLGKIDQFFDNGSAIQTYNNYSIAGLRLNSQGVPVSPDTATSTPLDTDSPTIIGPLTLSTDVPQNLQVIQMGLSSNGAFSPPTQTSYAVGFIQSLGTYGQSGAENGAQPIQLYYINGLGGNPAQPLSGGLGGVLTVVPSDQGVVMCVTDGTKYAYIGIGVGSNFDELDVKVEMLGSTSC